MSECKHDFAYGLLPVHVFYCRRCKKSRLDIAVAENAKLIQHLATLEKAVDLVLKVANAQHDGDEVDYWVPQDAIDALQAAREGK